jgi:hypothetical protein
MEGDMAHACVHFGSVGGLCFQGLYRTSVRSSGRFYLRSEKEFRVEESKVLHTGAFGIRSRIHGLV